MSERDNPFGSEPSDNPFGSPPPSDPFGQPPPTDPFGRAAPSGERRHDASQADRPVAGSPYGDPFGPPPVHDATGPPAADPFAPRPADPLGAPPTEHAWQRPDVPRDPYTVGPPAGKADGAVAALVLGLVGITVCQLCAPFAWYHGRRAERLIDASGGTLSGRGEATAGKILGIVACVLVVLGILLFVALAVGMTSSSSSSRSVTIGTSS